MKRLAAAGVCALSLALLAPSAGADSPATGSASPADRYALAGGCYALRSRSLGRLVAKDPAGGYAVSAAGVDQAERFRMQATDLGRYLFYGRARDFLAAGSQPLSGDTVEAASQPSESADWRVDAAGSGAFKVVLPSEGKVLAVSGGRLVLVDPGGAGNAAVFTFEPTTRCSVYPEVETSAVGTPFTGTPAYGEVRGLVDAHMHMMAFEFLGGRIHCGTPWHRYGAPFALVDCPDHEPNGCGAALETVLGGTPCHDPVGWPTFKDWPDYRSLTHETSYYKWLERAWMGGQRVFVNLLVENEVLCELYPLKKNSCDEMDSVRLQAKRIYELQDYIDAQNGGPGKGWFRIVKDPFEARRVINAGKMAIVLGIEVSEPFGCGVYNDQPQCDERDIDRGLDEVYRLGVRDMEIINKFDNALGGVAGDTNETGVVVNNGNRYETGRYWDMRACTGPPEESDKQQISPFDHNSDDLIGNGLRQVLPPGTAPVYGPGPQCNAKGLTSLGQHLIRRMMAKRMIVDPDHLGVLARQQVMSLLEANDYSGAVSSHSWSTPDVYPRIFRLGGFVAPYAGDSTGFVNAWREIRQSRDDRFYFGFGYGADMNGFGAQGGPREGAKNPVRYPFKSFDGGVTLNRQRSGQRVYDINVDGVDHYGLYPDWLEDLRMIAGDAIVEDMARGAESYLEMWERAEGIRRSCRRPRMHFTARSLGSSRLGYRPDQQLRRAGQPVRRTRAWRYCVRGLENRRAKVVAVFTPRRRVGLVVSTARRHAANGIGRGARTRKLRGHSRRLGSGLWARRVSRGGARFVYGVRRGRVRYVALASGSVAKSRRRLRAYLRLAGVR